MNCIVVDFETYYDTTYSLSKMPTDEYVLSPLYETMGVSVKNGHEDIKWFSGTEQETADWLAQFPWATSAVACHHVLFDAFILTQRFGIKPKLWMCTKSMATALYPYLKSFSLAALCKHFGLPDKGTEVKNMLGRRRATLSPDELQAYGEYCKLDVELTYRLMNLLTPQLPAMELRLIDITARMFVEPRFIGDQVMLRGLYEGELARKVAIIALASTDRTILQSNDKFAAKLAELGVAAPTKRSLKTGKVTWAFAKTDAEFTALLSHENPDVQALVSARLGVKSTIAETRALNMLKAAQRGPLPVYLNYWGAKVSGRHSGGNGNNYQNLPARGPSAGIRHAVGAPEGHSVVVCDSSNIELRVAMVIARQMDVVQKLIDKVDLYCDFAGKMFGRTITKADKRERTLGKLACIAEGELVLTDAGLVPIEQVSILHKLWDGVEWVSHGGVVCQGVKDVITYQGLRATPDHLVYLESGVWAEFGKAAASKARIAVTGHGGREIPLMDHSRDGATRELGAMPLRLRSYEVGHYGQLKEREVDTVQRLRHGMSAHTQRRHGTPGGSATSEASTTGRGRPGSVRQPFGEKLASLWRARDRVSVPVGTGVCGVHDSAAECFADAGDRPHKQRRALRAGEPTVRDPRRELQQSAQYEHGGNSRGGHTGSAVEGPLLRGYCGPLCADGDDRGADHRYGAGRGTREAEELAWDSATTDRVRVYDIVDAGPRNRFTVGDALVHNCLSLQYGAGWRKFKEMVRIQAGISLTDGEAESIVQLYRRTHYKVVDMWERMQEVVLPEIASGNHNLLPVDDLAWCMCTGEGFGLAGYPGVVYHDLHMEDGEWMYTMADKPVKIYAGKCFENLCQHVARQIVMWQTVCIADKYPVSLTVHDEAVCVVPDDQAEACKAYMEQCMATAPAWCKNDIPLACEAGIGKTYGDAK